MYSKIKIWCFCMLAMLMLVGGEAFSQGGATTRLVHDFDYFGNVASLNFNSLRDLSIEVSDSLPGEYGEDFQVVDGGQYFLGNYFTDSPLDKFNERFEILSEGREALLYIGRVVNLKGEVEYHSRVHLSENELYPCISSTSVKALESQLNGVMNEYGATNPVQGEYEGVKKFLKIVTYLTTCCQVNENKKANDICTRCDIDLSPFSDPFGEFHNMILNHGDVVSKGRFTFLENTDFSFNLSGNNFRNSTLLETEVPNLVASLVSHSPEGTFDFFQELEQIKIFANDIGRGDDVKVSVLYIDETNCSNLQGVLLRDLEWNGSHSMSGGTCGSENGISCNGGGCMLYEEQIIILNIDDEIRVYSRILSPFPDFDVNSQNFSGESENKSLIIPALIIREVLKRAAMGAINVLIDVGVSIAIEKGFGSPSDCSVNGINQDTWGDAWTRYRIEEFSNARYAVWKVFLVFAEGAIGSDRIIFEIVSGGLQSSLKYLITGNENLVGPGTGVDSKLINGPPVDAKAQANFNLKTFFKKFVTGAAGAVIGRGLGPVARWGGRVAKKLRENFSFPQSANNFSIVEEFRAGLILSCIKEPRLIVTWWTSFSRGVPRNLRRNVDFLRIYFKALSERVNVGRHLRGEINVNGRAVGCHFSSAVDGVNVRVRSLQPPGFPTYFDPPANSQLKEALIDINDGAGNWIPKNARSSFFPSNWDEDKVFEEVARLRINPSNAVPGNPRKWIGPASDGTPIEVSYTGADLTNLVLSTVFPK